MQELSSLAKKYDKNAKFPEYMGIDYSTSLFDWQDVNNSEWKWNANQDTLSELRANGGDVKTFSSSTITENEMKFLTNQMETNNENQLLLNHFKTDINGIVISVPDNIHITEPLNLTIDATSNHSVALTLILNIGSNSSVSINERVNISGKAKQASINVTGKVASNSSVDFSTIMTSLSDTKLFIFGDQNVQQNANLNWAYFSSCRGNILGELTTHLNEQGARANFYGLEIANSNDQIGLQAAIKHHAGHSTSRINMRGVLLNDSKLEFTSIGQIDNGASLSDAQQESRLMTVGKNANGSVNPLLLIDENDVIAGHAASVGRFNDEQLYYLLSRGIPESAAKQILINSFIAPVASHLPAEAKGIISRYFD